MEDAPVCVSPQSKSALERSPDYPSGHTAAGWEAGLVLAQLVPEQTTAVLARAAAFGQSRIVCGVHNTSAVQAGQLTAVAIFAAQNSSAEFRRDIDAARTEVSELLAQPLAINTQACELERETLSQQPY